MVFKDNIDAKITPDGLKIDVSDSDKYAMYEPNSGKLTTFGETVLKKLGELVKQLPNHISITGHTDASKVEKPGGYSNWELSTDRANSARRFLSAQLETDRVSKVIGSADRELALPSSPTSPKNRRISLLLLRGSYMEGQANNDNIREVLTVPQPTDVTKIGAAKHPAGTPVAPGGASSAPPPPAAAPAPAAPASAPVQPATPAATPIPAAPAKP
jgi:chemotaxis protein MotB